jgi:hypothetical protein
MMYNAGRPSKEMIDSVDYPEGKAAIELTSSLSVRSDDDQHGVKLQRRGTITRVTTTGMDSFIEHSNNTSVAAMAQYNDMSALFDMNIRNNLNIMPKLIQYVRSAFLEIVKANYWYDIQRGVLPRLSYAATYLLYTVDVGLDKLEIEEDDEFGTADWRVLFSTVCRMPLYLRVWSYLEQMMFTGGRYRVDCGLSVYFLSKHEAMVEKRNVYMLTSFIAAHELAQNKLHEFLLIDTIGSS